MNEPCPPDPIWPRYTSRPLPLYRFIPGRSPHPRKDSRGHSYREPEPRLAAFPPEDWRRAEDYLYGIDLYNFAYWWECHEVFESLWHAVGTKTEQGNFFQALIQFAAANLKRFTDREPAVENLLRYGLRRLERLPAVYMGVDIVKLSDETRSFGKNRRDQPPLIALEKP
jgi:hypothetical protein